uniref:BTB domain-containing protein n=1 Tax=Panagrellus redivivus TaxID=6233 RepID=A0A7E4W625_PANRE
MLFISWWLSSIFGAMLMAYYVTFWRPEPTYNKFALLTFFWSAISSINCVHISQFFLTVERVIVMKSSNSSYNQKILLTLCIFVNVVSSISIGILFLANFNPNDDEKYEIRMPIQSVIDRKSYLILYYMTNGVSIITLLASLYSLILFRKTVITTEIVFTKVQNTIKYTIWVDIWFDFLPQILTVGLTLPKLVTTFHDKDTFTLYKADLTRKKVKEFLETPKRDIPSSDGFQWWIQYFPAGDRKKARDHLSLYLVVNRPVKAKFTFAIDNSSIKRTESYDFYDVSESFGWHQFQSHGMLMPHWRNDKLTITCTVEFYVKTLATSFKPCLFRSCDHVPTDFELVMKKGTVSTHKSFLSMLSPVFHAMFSHDTAESKSGKVKITDFDYSTVKATIDFCYGRELGEFSINLVINILRFADKYDIKAVAQLEQIPPLNLSTITFCPIVKFAYDCNKEDLMAQCCSFFKDHQVELKIDGKFTQFPPTFVVHLLKRAFDLKTDFDVLRHANKNDIKIVDYFKSTFLNEISGANFCLAVNYAWDCSQDDLKMVCAEYLNSHLEVVKLKELHDLSAKTVRELLKLANNVEHTK